jgi:hypothetical protein
LAKVQTLELPFQLIEAVKSRRAIPFLGAGASKEATNASRARPPDASQLRDIIAQRFFNRDMSHRDVMAVAEMAIAASGGQAHVFELVREAFDKFEPGEAHRLLTQFNWRMLATTNYDLFLERAYEEPQRRQNLVRFVKDDEPIEERLQAVSNPIQYLKLHGCVDHLHDAEIPLVLAREQYAAYSEHRARLFNRLRDYARESTLIFIGYRLDDAHVRELIYSLQSNRRPRWFIVTPDAEDYDVDFWATKNVGVVRSRFPAAYAAGIEPMELRSALSRQRRCRGGRGRRGVPVELHMLRDQPHIMRGCRRRRGEARVRSFCGRRLETEGVIIVTKRAAAMGSGAVDARTEKPVGLRGVSSLVVLVRRPGISSFAGP